MRRGFVIGLIATFYAAAAPRSFADESKSSEPAEPFAFADFSWAPGNYGPSESKLATKYFTPEIRLDGAAHYEFSNPQDDTISGSSEVFRHREFQLTQIGVGGDFKVDNVGFRFMTQFGMYSQTTPRNDPTPSRGQWRLDDAYRYISEAYGTYHLNYMNGVNIQTGIFMSYVGLWSYYNFDNWTYQPSYVSSNTPWFFNGARIQFFPSDKLKIETWLVNGWQAYGMYIDEPGIGLQIQWRPTGQLAFVGNQYYGKDNMAVTGAHRIHTDDSVMVKYYENQGNTISKAAASLTFDAGCEDGGSGTDSNGQQVHVSCGGQYFMGFMAYNRLWFSQDHYAFTIGGGAIRNPGRYLVLEPPINGATAATGSPYFSENPGDDFKAWDIQIAADYMPNRNLTFRLEYNHRAASVPYFSGPGGLTPPSGSVTDSKGNVTVNGAPWSGPDLVKAEDRVTLAMMIRL